ncbi:MAG: insulinase family protein [Porticoccaceae bacterium]
MTWFSRYRRRSALLLALLVFVSAGFVILSQDKDEPWWVEGSGEGGEAVVKRSPGDDRGYRYLHLPNHLQVLLISDPTADKGAAALNVRVGSFDNPEGRDGLAHFLEHMLFLGTEKYPEAGDYQAFISEHGGTHNAYTSLENTTYYFDVDARYLADTLDRFAQFFIAPRFDATYVDRERHAVNSEFRLKIRDDGRREWDVLSELINPRHPLSHFSVGDLETLADRPQDPVREDLVAFYREHYSADRMALVVLGKEPLAELETAVRSRFSAVPNHDHKGDEPVVPLFSSKLPREVFIKPDQEKRELNLLFPLPSQKTHWRTKPAEFLAYLIGGEGEGSLLANLKASGLAEGLSAGLGFDADRGAAFSISIALTPAGVAQRDRILGQTFGWLEQVRKEAIVDWRYAEFSRLEQINFRFLEKQSPATYVQGLSSTLHQYPPAEVLRGPSLLVDFDAPLIRHYADKLVADNALITLVAPEATALDQVSGHYGATYRTADVTEEVVARWRHPQPVEELRLAARNPYIPAQFPISGKGGTSAKPVLERHDQRVTLWHYADDRFATPRATFIARLATPMAAGLPRAAAMTQLYLALVRDQLSAELYPALLAGLDFDLSIWHNGIVLSLQGYVDKQPVLLATLLRALREPKLDAERFARVKAMLVREWRNSAREWPIKQVFEELSPLLGEGYRKVELADALASVTEPELQIFVAGFYRRGHGVFYAGGALPAASAYAMADATASQLQLGSDGDAELFQRVLRLSPTALRPQYCVAIDQNENGAVLYLQGATDSLEERAHIAVLAGVLEAPFYTELRTQRQLGYVVGSNILPINRVPGMIFYVQSPMEVSASLMEEISGFLVRFETTIAQLSDADLERYRQAVLTGIEERPKNIVELTARHQESLLLGFSDMDFREQLVRAVLGVTRDSLLAAYRRIALVASRGLWVTTLDKSSAEQCVDREALAKRSNGYYLFPQ